MHLVKQRARAILPALLAAAVACCAGLAALSPASAEAQGAGPQSTVYVGGKQVAFTGGTATGQTVANPYTASVEVADLASVPVAVTLPSGQSNGTVDYLVTSGTPAPAPTGTITATLTGDSLVVGKSLSGQTIKLTLSGSLEFKTGVSADDFQLTGGGVGGLTISEVERSNANEVVITLGGTVTAAGDVNVIALASAFTTPAGPITSTGEISVSAPSGSITAALENGPLVQGVSAESVKIKLTIGGGELTFNSGSGQLEKSNFSLSGDAANGLDISGVEATSSITATVSLSGTPEKVGTFSVVVQPGAFSVAPSSEIASTTVTVDAPSGSISETLGGSPATLKAGQDASDTTVTLEARGSIKFNNGSLTTQDFSLKEEPDNPLSIGSIETQTETQVVLKLSGTPTSAGSVTVTALKSAFKYPPIQDLDATPPLTIEAADGAPGLEGPSMSSLESPATIVYAPTSNGEIETPLGTVSNGIASGTVKTLTEEDNILWLLVQAGDTTEVFKIAVSQAPSSTTPEPNPNPGPGTSTNPNPGNVGWGEGSGTSGVGSPDKLVDAIEQAKPGTEFTVNLPASGQQITFTADAPVPTNVKVTGAVLGFPEAKTEGAVTTVYNPTTKAFTLTAQPVKGYRFVGWTLAGQTISSANPWQVTMASQAEATALATTPAQAAPGAYVAVFEAEVPAPTTVEAYRIQNPVTNQHLYTADMNEYSYWTTHGWVGENVAWTAPASSDRPIYRLRHAGGGHLYTADPNEYRHLDATPEWVGEGIAMYSAPDTAVPVYRLFDPTLPAGDAHLWTADLNEYNYQGDHGWDREDVAFYAITAPGMQ